MNTDMTWQTVSADVAITEKMAADIGSRLRGGEVIELVSDLGGGKTAFVRGLARGMGSNDVVASPSFTINKEYKAASLTLYHYDFYRLHEPGLLVQQLSEVMIDPQAVTVIEWSDMVTDILPTDRLTVRIVKISETSRQLYFSAGGPAAIKLRKE